MYMVHVIYLIGEKLEEIDSRMTYEGLPSFNIKSLKQKGNKLYFEGEVKTWKPKIIRTEKRNC